MALFGRKQYTLVNVKKKEIPTGLWTKCPDCSTPTYKKELDTNLNICPKCQCHLSLTARQRIDSLIDAGTFQESDRDLNSGDPLGFKGPKTYKEKLTADQRLTGLREAVVTGMGRLKGHPMAIAVTDSRFIMGSMGSVLGEKITRSV